jgi:Fe(3+) dicitrate transport protein
MKKALLVPLLIINLSSFADTAKKDSLKQRELQNITIISNNGKSMPGSGQYIDSRKIEKLNQPNINNVLRIVPGVNVRDEEGFGLRPNIGLRGTPVNRSAKITLMEDGILIAPAPYADPAAYYFPTFARMSGVEVLKGSSQIKYGPYSIGGAVNLLTTPIPNNFKAFAQLGYGSFNTNQQRFWVGDNRKNFDYVFEVNRIASDGFKELDNGGNTGFDRRDVMGKLRWHTAATAKVQQSLSLKFVNSTEDGNETYLGLTYDDYQKNPLRRYAGTQLDILDLSHQDVSLSHSIIPIKNLSINTTAYYTTTYRDWARANSFGGQSINSILNNPSAQQNAYDIMTGNANGNIDYQSAARTYFAQGVQLNANYFFNTANINHKIQVGLRYHEDEADRFATRSVYTMTDGRMALTTAGIKGNSENQIRSATSIASFISYDFQYKGLKVSPGLRHEKINLDIQNFGTADNARTGSALLSAANDLSIFIPGVGINYDINAAMSVFGGVHKGFSPPGTPSTSSTVGQAMPETSVNYEMGYRYAKNAASIQLVGFINDYDNILGSDNISGGGAGTGDQFNAGKALIQGLELSAGVDLLHLKINSRELKIPFNLSYTLTSATFEQTFVNGGGDWGSGTINEGDLIPFITPHLLTAELGFETRKFNTSVIARYTGETRVKPGQGDAVLPSSTNGLADINAIEGFLIVDLSANYQFSKTFSAYGLVNNLTNSTAIVANLPQGYRPNMPLSLMMGIKANF